MKKKLLYFNGVIDSGKYYDEEKILFFTFIDVEKGEKLEVTQNPWGEYTPIEIIVECCKKHADIIWLPDTEEIKRVPFPFEDVKNYYDSIASITNEEEINKAVLKQFNVLEIQSAQKTIK